MSQFSEKTLVCRDCGREFTFSVGEQSFYAARDFSEPTRCPECRAARKASREAAEYSSYGSGSRGGRGSYGGTERRGRSGGSHGTRQLYKVTCADCGVETEVPFEPQTGRPVYCRDCFEKHRMSR